MRSRSWMALLGLFTFLTSLILSPFLTQCIQTSSESLLYLRSAGAPTSQAFQISNSTFGAYSPDIAVDANGTIHVTWLDEQGLHYSTLWNDSFTTNHVLVWNVSEPVFNTTEHLSKARIQVDEHDAVHLAAVYESYVTYNRSLWHFYKPNGSTIFTPTCITSLLQQNPLIWLENTTTLYDVSWRQESYSFWVQDNVSYFSLGLHKLTSIDYMFFKRNLTSGVHASTEIHSTDLISHLHAGSPFGTWIRPGPNASQVTYFFTRVSHGWPSVLQARVYTHETTAVLADTIDLVTTDAYDRVFSPHWYDQNATFGFRSAFGMYDFDLYAWSPPSNISLLRSFRDTRLMIDAGRTDILISDEGQLHVLHPTVRLAGFDQYLLSPIISYKCYDLNLRVLSNQKVFLFPELQDPRDLRSSFHNGTVHVTWQAGNWWEMSEVDEGYQVYYTNSSYLCSELGFFPDLSPFIPPIQEIIQYAFIGGLVLVVLYYLTKYMKKRRPVRTKIKRKRSTWRKL